MKIYGIKIFDPNSLDATMADLGSKATYTGAGGTGLGWLLSSEGGILVGILLAVAGFLLNWYFSVKKDKREQAAHEALMARLAAGGAIE